MDNFEEKRPEQQEPGQEPEKEPEKKSEHQGQAQAPKTGQKVYYDEVTGYGYQKSNQNPGGQMPYGAYQPQPRRGLPPVLKAFIIVMLIMALIVLLFGSCVSTTVEAVVNAVDTMTETESGVTTSDATGEYVGVIHIESTISESGSTSEYNHEYILKSIDDMAKDDNNKGIILYMNTPGGTVFASDDVYFAILDYQQKTGRPVYSSMQAQCTSGGYYISAPCDKIYANRNCWTGSIGVTVGTMIDVSELLDNLGVKTVTITSGENKAMGSYYEPLTEEQQEIMQTLVDEAYEQFVGIVADGRNMDIDEVKQIADGRIYSASQAKELGLIDEIGTYEDCKDAMIKDNALGADCQIIDFKPSTSQDWMSYLGIIADENEKDASSTITAKDIQDLVNLNGKIQISYLAQ